MAPLGCWFGQTSITAVMKSQRFSKRVCRSDTVIFVFAIPYLFLCWSYLDRHWHLMQRSKQFAIHKQLFIFIYIFALVTFICDSTFHELSFREGMVHTLYFAIYSLDPGKLEWNFRNVIFKWVLLINGFALLWMSLDFNKWWSVKIGSGNGLVPSGNKPLPEPVLTQISVAMWCH